MIGGHGELFRVFSPAQFLVMSKGLPLACPDVRQYTSPLSSGRIVPIVTIGEGTCNSVHPTCLSKTVVTLH